MLLFCYICIALYHCQVEQNFVCKQLTFLLFFIIDFHHISALTIFAGEAPKDFLEFDFTLNMSLIKWGELFKTVGACCKMAKRTLKILRFLKYVWPYYNIIHERIQIWNPWMGYIKFEIQVVVSYIDDC